MIGANISDDYEEVNPWLEEKEISWRNFWDVGYIDFCQGDPYMYVIDEEGIIRFSGSDVERLAKVVEELMADAGHEIEIKIAK